MDLLEVEIKEHLGRERYETVCNDLDNDGKIVNKAACVCMGISMEWYKDILEI